MFGLSFGELAVLVIVAIVVIGPKDLPKVLRKLGEWSGKLRRMAFDLRAQSGIDDVLNAEGLSADLHEIRKLARGELDGVVAATRLDSPYDAPATESPALQIEVPREREYPREGADAYGALPDTAIVYLESLPASTLSLDPIYTCGIDTPPLPQPAPEDGTRVPEAVEPHAHVPPAPPAPLAAEAASEPTDAPP